MSSLSLNAISQMYQATSSDPLLMLLTLNFPNGNNFYYVNNTENITSNSQVFTAFPFMFSLPNDSDEEIPELTLSISNIGLELVDDFSSNVSDIFAKVQAVFASAPDTIELNIDNLIVKRVSTNANSINITLGYEDILNIIIPSYSYDAKDFPGLLNV